MKVLVASKLGNGLKPDDFFFAEEGEIVYVSDCDSCNDCGCRRSTVGVNSGKGTTTMTVIESQMTREDFFKVLLKAKREYIKLGVSERSVVRMADALLELAGELPTGAVIERNGEDFEPREIRGH